VNTDLHGVILHVYLGEVPYAHVHHGIFDHESRSYPVLTRAVERTVDSEGRERIAVALDHITARVLGLVVYEEGEPNRIAWVDSPDMGPVSISDGTFTAEFPMKDAIGS
jgi:hypothetical protein